MCECSCYLWGPVVFVVCFGFCCNLFFSWLVLFLFFWLVDFFLCVFVIFVCLGCFVVGADVLKV